MLYLSVRPYDDNSAQLRTCALPTTMAQSKTNAALESELYKAYFDDPTLSDLTIRLTDRSLHVHRIVLCRGSGFFTSLLLSGSRVRKDQAADQSLERLIP